MIEVFLFLVAHVTGCNEANCESMAAPPAGSEALLDPALPKKSCAKSHDRWLASRDTDTGGMRFARFCLI